MLRLVRGCRGFSIQIVFLFGLLASACGRDPNAETTGRIPSHFGNGPTPLDRGGELITATTTLGPLYVKEGIHSAEAAIRPWSAWWYPVRETGLFQGDKPGESPLEKYDLYVKNVHKEDAGAAAFERDRLFDPFASSWEGHCNAWSIASLMEPEPQAPVKAAGIRFGVGDQKALLIKTYESVPGIRIFGQRYNGDRFSVYDDIYPDQLHRVIQDQLFEKRRGLIVDKEPGVAVWNFPIWKADFEVRPDVEDVSRVHVVLWLHGASPFVSEPEFRGTLPLAFRYTYDLIGEWIDSPQGRLFQVSWGEWTQESRDYHPDFVTVLPDTRERSSKNEKIRNAYVEEILRAGSP